MHFGWLVRSARLVAVKRTHPHMLGEVQDCVVARRLAHANVVPTLGLVRQADECIVLMEYVAGASLAEILDAAPTPIDPRIAVAVAAGVLRGLDATHQACIVPGHRDVSPACILVAEHGNALLIDFDLPGPRTAHTIVDKLPYASPETLLRSSFDVRRDVYAVSALLWETLTGRRLFWAPSVEGTLRMIFTESAVAAPSRFAPWLPPAIDAIVLRGLARDPSLRFASPLEMALALERTPRFLASPEEISRWLATLDVPSMRRRSALAREVTIRESKLHSESSARGSKL
jgi:serine/threonine-protein kinase